MTKIQNDLFLILSNMGPFIKYVINQGGGGFAKRWSYLISWFSKSDDEGGRGVKNHKKLNDDVFYERLLLTIYYILGKTGISPEKSLIPGFPFSQKSKKWTWTVNPTWNAIVYYLKLTTWILICMKTFQSNCRYFLLLFLQGKKLQNLIICDIKQGNIKESSME